MVKCDLFLMTDRCDLFFIFWPHTGKTHASWCDVYAYGTSRLSLPEALAKKFFLHPFLGSLRLIAPACNSVEISPKSLPFRQEDISIYLQKHSLSEIHVHGFLHIVYFHFSVLSSRICSALLSRNLVTHRYRSRQHISTPHGQQDH